MNLLELSLFVITVIAMISIPGPVMILVASAGIKGGYKAALRTIFGTNLASLVLIMISIFVLKGFLSIDEKIFLTIKVIGCLYIAYLGHEILKEIFQKNEDDLSSIQPAIGGFRKGFFVGISNPKDIIFFSSFFPQFINVHTNINISLVTLIITWIILDFLTLSIVYKAFNTLSKSQIYSKILALCGFLLLGIAIYGTYASIQEFQ